MMREILFRGKTVKGEWVQGYLFDDGMVNSEKMFIGSLVIKGYKGTASDAWEVEHCFCEVIPETVGQYTGLTNRNGKKIFEGDIVIDKYSKEKFGFIGVVIYNPILTQFQIYSDKQPDYVVNLGSRIQSSKVIGNIHDNPELLKGGAE